MNVLPVADQAANLSRCPRWAGRLSTGAGAVKFPTHTNLSVGAVPPAQRADLPVLAGPPSRGPAQLENRFTNMPFETALALVPVVLALLRIWRPPLIWINLARATALGLPGSAWPGIIGFARRRGYRQSERLDFQEH
jgi:hypothetical protein